MVDSFLIIIDTTETSLKNEIKTNKANSVNIKLKEKDLRRMFDIVNTHKLLKNSIGNNRPSLQIHCNEKIVSKLLRKERNSSP